MKANSWITGIYLNKYETDMPDGTLAGFDADYGEMIAFEGKLIPVEDWNKALLEASRFEHVTEKNADQTPLRARRNGKNKTWKRDKQKFQIPVKYGLKICFYITPENARFWRPAK